VQSAVFYHRCLIPKNEVRLTQPTLVISKSALPFSQGLHNGHLHQIKWNEGLWAQFLGFGGNDLPAGILGHY